MFYRETVAVRRSRMSIACPEAPKPPHFIEQMPPTWGILSRSVLFSLEELGSNSGSRMRRYK
jgi:hypothetical protein